MLSGLQTPSWFRKAKNRARGRLPLQNRLPAVDRNAAPVPKGTANYATDLFHTFRSAKFSFICSGILCPKLGLQRNANPVFRCNFGWGVCALNHCFLKEYRLGSSHETLRYIADLPGCCGRLQAQVQPPVATAPPPAPAPTANISASPTAVTAGEPVTLTWNTSNATVPPSVVSETLPPPVQRQSPRARRLLIT